MDGAREPARPLVYFSEYTSLAVEPGLDWVQSSQGEADGWLGKLSIAPQVSSSRTFFSRPVARVFVTFAEWSDGVRGAVGGDPYLRRTQGLTYGAQMEGWW